MILFRILGAFLRAILQAFVAVLHSWIGLALMGVLVVAVLCTTGVICFSTVEGLRFMARRKRKADQ